MTQKVLVTGATGFVAGWCIVELLRRGYDVRATVRPAVLGSRREAELRAALSREGVAAERLALAGADLLADAGWDEAMAGCDFVLHVASPLGGGNPKDRESFIAPARDGTLRVLRAAVQAGVQRVVMTSAAAAARPPLSSYRASDESIWADADDPQFDAYRVSKILAERAAWDFIARSGGNTQFVTVLPGAVFGPLLTRDNLGLLDGRPPAVPRLGFWIVDVRDLAALHVRALTTPAAAGERFIAVGEFLWMEEMAKLLRSRLPEAGARTPTRRLPDFVVRLLLPFSANLKSLAPLLGRRFEIATDKSRNLLGFSPRPVSDTLADCARSLGSS